MYVPTYTPEEAVEELCDAILCLGRAVKSGHDVGVAGQQERLIQAIADSRRSVRAPVLKVTGPGKLPTRSHENDAGLDLYTLRDTTIRPGEFVDVDCGVSVEFPPGWWGRIVGRSSTLRQRGLLVAEGTIDEGYRGKLFAGVRSLHRRAVHLQEGDRVAQLILVRTPPMDLEIQRVVALSESARGEGGFGSTGR